MPAISVTLDPAHAIARLNVNPSKVRLTAEVHSNVDGGSDGTLRLDVPAGWNVTPAAHRFASFVPENASGLPSR